MTRWAEHTTIGLVCAVMTAGGVACDKTPKTRPLEADSHTPSVTDEDVRVVASVAPAAVSGVPPNESRPESPLPKGLVAKPERTAPAVKLVIGAEQACPSDMVLVSGEYCPGLVQPCLKWVKPGVRRCAVFGESRCVGKRHKRRFCIDRYEYPNQLGVKPAVMVRWYDALRACEIEGKRLCLASEWTFACEGLQGLPYPYGHARDPRICNFERPRPKPEPRFDLFAKPHKVGAEVARLDMRIGSGRLNGCVSPFGVHDMSGNVDEWVLNEAHFDQPRTQDRKPPHISGLKGGYWGPIRAACRPITTAHIERFRFYQVGFRCCANAKTQPDGVADRYTSRLKPWRIKAGVGPDG